jgi:acyl-CoA synthetase (AMP-forming)/AMP-acid ligase II
LPATLNGLAGGDARLCTVLAETGPTGSRTGHLARRDDRHGTLEGLLKGVDSTMAEMNVRFHTLEDYETEFADRHLLHGAVSKWAVETPDRVAIIEFDTGREFTYRQFDAAATAIALKLLELGFRKGDFLATSLPLLAEHVFLEYACFKIGVIHAPLDLRLKGPEVVRSIGLIRAKGFALLGQTPYADFRPLGQLVRQECPYVEHILQFSPPDDCIPGATSMLALAGEVAALAANPSASPMWEEYQRVTASISENDGAQVIYTTGSTGFPKPALQSHRNITCQNMCLAGGFGMQKTDRMLVNLPPSHVGCQAEQLITTFFCGNTAVIMWIFDAEKTLQAIEKYKIQVMGQIPAMFNMQWRLPNYGQYDLSSLELVLYGGQQVTVPFLDKLRQMAPRAATGLGLTEMAGFVTYSKLDGTLEELAASVGFDMPVTPLTIRQPMKEDGSAGEVLPDGTIGEICFSGPQVFIGYVNNEEAYRKTVSSDGVCYTGDLGYRDGTGLHFTGRSKLVIKPKGYQVYPAQVEEHFAQLRDLVANVAAVGAPHEVFSEGIILFVERHPQADLGMESLAEHAKEIAAYMRPSHYEILEPGTFPLNRVAKTDYVLLKERAMTLIENLRSAGSWDR